MQKPSFQSFFSPQRTREVGLILVLALVLALGLSSASWANTITVNSTSDVIANDDQCTLREAIIAANTDTASGAMDGECPAGFGGDLITLPSGTYTLTLIGNGEEAASTGDLDITDHVTIMGAGQATTIIDGGISNLASDRVFHVHSGTIVGISSVTIQNGYIIVGSSGGGISNEGTLTIVDSTVTNNFANGAGGIVNTGTLTINMSTVSDNAALGHGGGISNEGTLTIVDSTVRDNSCSFGGSGIFNEDTLTINNSTISHNSSWEAALHNTAAGIATLTNVTVSGNNALIVGSGITNHGTLMLNNCTVSNNEDIDVDGGGLLATAISTPGTGTSSLKNTIVADNIGGDCDSPVNVNSLGYNLDSDGSCGLTNTGDLSNTDPLLGSLLDNSGPTFTHALLPGSPAIDAGSSTDCLPADQRGVVRPQGEGCDIGAFEATPEELVDSLRSEVEDLGPEGSGALSGGQENSLLAQLDAAIDSLEGGNTNAACNQLQAFINHVMSFIRAGVLTSAQGEGLIDDAESIRTSLGCDGAS